MNYCRTILNHEYYVILLQVHKVVDIPLCCHTRGRSEAGIGCPPTTRTLVFLLASFTPCAAAAVSAHDESRHHAKILSLHSHINIPYDIYDRGIKLLSLKVVTYEL